jgi:ribosome recycling factor
MRDLNELMKMGEISEDDERRAEAELQQMTDKYVGRIDEALSDKEAELLEV